MLKESRVHEYWEQRAAKQGMQTVGFSNRSLDFQSRLHKQRIKFIFPRCPQFLKTLDFGCGTGNFANCFESYLGVDISETLLAFARATHPEKDFILLEQPIPSEKAILLFNPELFFSATVLQHNSDNLVRKIFKSIAQIEQDMIFSIYENCQVIAKHVKGRESEEYLALLGESFKILSSRSFSHCVHGEKHALTIAKTEPL
ncbi:MAG: class I SAM-dependent methyltransferase [Candidatus Cloacimonadota bacterium]|nr:MAG: class I SAM-dependent methyltransferase [Candidatus Cloacimonadota bacterium]